MSEIYGEYVKAVNLNGVRHDLKDEEIGLQVAEIADDVDALKTAMEGAEDDIDDLGTSVGVLQTDMATAQGDIDDLETAVGALQTDMTTAQGDIDDIEDLIPNQASAQNQLADKNFVNSSITTNTANFLGTYTTLADIEAIQNPTNNDYAFLETTDQAGNTLYDRYKYTAIDNEWLFEYELNNSGFSASQWATINSGLTQSSVDGDIADAIGDLDVASVGGAGEYIESISEADGKITAVKQTMDTTPTANSSKACTSGGVKAYVDNQVTQAIAQVLDTGF